MLCVALGRFKIYATDFFLSFTQLACDFSCVVNLRPLSNYDYYGQLGSLNRARVIRDRFNPFDAYSEEEFRSQFRLFK